MTTPKPATTKERPDDQRPPGGRPHGLLATFFPGYFALVMATAIISVAAFNRGWVMPARGLLALNLVFFFILLALLCLRLVRHFSRVVADFLDHERGPGFFTVVAAFCILGSQIHLLTGNESVPRALWWAAIFLWALVMYGFFTATIVREHKPTLETGINGAWLIAIVATQSVSTLGALLAGSGLGPVHLVLFFSLCMYLLGAMLYLTIITLIFYRFTFLALPMERLTPPYWINMGAVAITTLAGSTLMLRADAWFFLQELRPFLTGFTLFFWSAATWWIPLLLILGCWRHLVRRYTFRYDPQYWGMVFPLGMYCVCTDRLATASALSFLTAIPDLFFFVAAAAWLATFANMLWSLGARLLARSKV